MPWLHSAFFKEITKSEVLRVFICRRSRLWRPHRILQDRLCVGRQRPSQVCTPRATLFCSLGCFLHFAGGSADRNPETGCRRKASVPRSDPGMDAQLHDHHQSPDRVRLLSGIPKAESVRDDSCYVIDFKAGRSFGEQQATIIGRVFCPYGDTGHSLVEFRG